MKKIIAISLMFALVAAAVFAETSISGGVETRFSLAKQTGDKNANGDTPDPVMGGSVASAEIVLSGSNDEGTLGGRWRWRNTNLSVSPVIDWSQGGVVVGDDPLFDQAFVWWKPVPQVKLFLGIEQDGLFDTADIAGWSFHAGDNDYLFNHHWDFWRQVFPGNWDGFGLAVSFYPIPGLDINLALPTGGVNWRQAIRSNLESTRPITDPEANPVGPDKIDANANEGMLPGRLRLVANYSLDFGKISFVYLGGGQVFEKGLQFSGIEYWGAGHPDKDNNGMVGLSALITAIDGMQIKVGGTVVLNTHQAPVISAGLAYVWNGDGFGVKVRGALVMQGESKDVYGTNGPGGADDDYPGNGVVFTLPARQTITAEVMPFFSVGESGQVLVDIGITQDNVKRMYGTTVEDSSLGWYVAPAYRLGIPGGAFKIGLQLYNNINFGGNIGISGADYVKWNIPFLFSFGF